MIRAPAWALIVAAGCAHGPPPPRALRPPPPDADSIWARAIAAWELGDDDKSLQALQKLLAHHPHHLEGQRALAEILLGKEGPETALAFLRERAAARPEETGPRFALGYALGRSGEPDQMREGRDLLTPLARDDGQALTLEVLSDLIAAMDNPRGASALAEQAARVRQREGAFDDEFDDLLKAGRYLHVAGEWDQAEALLERALRQAKVVHSGVHEVRALQALGASDQSRGRLRQAQERFAAAVAAAERVGHAAPLVSSVVNQAELAELRQDRQSADRHMARAAAYAGETPALAAEVRIRGARVLLGRGQDEAALDELAKAVEVLKEEGAWERIAAALDLAGQAHLSAGRWREAVAEYAQAVQVWAMAVEHGEDPIQLALAKVEMADALLDGGAVDDAAELFKDAGRLAEETGHRTLQRRIERGELLCDLRRGTPDDIAMALDRSQLISDPWVTAEAYVALGDWEAARPAAEAALDPRQDPEVRDMPVRFALLVAVLLNTGDIAGAWRAYAAGTIAQFQDRLRALGITPATPPAELSDARSAQAASLAAQVGAADAMLAEPLSPSVFTLWRQRRERLGMERRAWAAEVAAARPAWASLILPHAVPQTPRGRHDDEAAVAILPGEATTLAFIDGPDGFVVEHLPPFTAAEAADSLWRAVRGAAPSAKRFVLSPPPELTHLAWHRLPEAPAQVRYRPAAAPIAKPSPAAPPPPAQWPSDALQVSLPELLAAHLHGTTLTFDAPADPGAGPALDAVIRAALYAGADAVKVRLPAGEDGDEDELLYTR